MSTVFLSLKEYNELRDFKREITAGNVLVISYPIYSEKGTSYYYTDDEVVKELNEYIMNLEEENKDLEDKNEDLEDKNEDLECINKYLKDMNESLMKKEISCIDIKKISIIRFIKCKLSIYQHL